MDDLINGPASRDKLQKLWVALLDAFEAAMSTEEVPSPEMMSCVRMFVRDNRVKPDKDHVERLQVLYGQLAGRLMEVMESEKIPTGGNMETVRRFLQDSGISKDTEPKVGLEMLSNLSVPFQ